MPVPREALALDDGRISSLQNEISVAVKPADGHILVDDVRIVRSEVEHAAVANAAHRHDAMGLREGRVRSRWRGSPCMGTR